MIELGIDSFAMPIAAPSSGLVVNRTMTGDGLSV